jgi:hypothetical protein
MTEGTLRDGGAAGSEEVAADAIQLLTVANFNGLCRVIAALSDNGSLSPAQLDNIHDAMTTPLDDPDWRDDKFIADIRDTLESVLARASAQARARQGPEPGPD